MSKIFITGGAGYVGSALIPYLIEKGHSITVVDLMIYGKEVLKQHKNLNIIEGDIREVSLLEKHIKGNDVVIHLACISNDPSFELNPQLGKSINLDAFTPLVEISRKNKVSKFIYASSSSVYGIKDEPNVNEEMSLEPLTDYSKYKADCEVILKKYSSDQFTTTILRPATVCGYSPRQRLDVVVNILTNLAYNNRKIIVLGGDQLRPNIHIKDMILAYETVINAPKEIINNQIFNVGFENKKVIDLAETVKKVIGDDVIIEKIDSNDDRSYHISSKKIKKFLNFFPRYTTKDAIIELKKAFINGLLPNSLQDKKYFNLKTMQSINLK